MLEAAERIELSSSEVEARRIRPLCYAASLTNSGAGYRNRTCFVSLKRRVHIHICQSRKIWRVTLESNQPGSRLRGECISHLCQSPVLKHKKLVQEVGTESTPRDDRSRGRPSSSCPESHGAPFGS